MIVETTIPVQVPVGPVDTTANNESPADTDAAFVNVEIPDNEYFVIFAVVGTVIVPVPIRVPVVAPGCDDNGVPAEILRICTTTLVLPDVFNSDIVIAIWVTVPAYRAAITGIVELDVDANPTGGNSRLVVIDAVLLANSYELVIAVG